MKIPVNMTTAIMDRVQAAVDKDIPEGVETFTIQGNTRDGHVKVEFTVSHGPPEGDSYADEE